MPQNNTNCKIYGTTKVGNLKGLKVEIGLDSMKSKFLGQYSFNHSRWCRDNQHIQHIQDGYIQDDVHRSDIGVQLQHLSFHSRSKDIQHIQHIQDGCIQDDVHRSDIGDQPQHLSFHSRSKDIQHIQHIQGGYIQDDVHKSDIGGQPLVQPQPLSFHSRHKDDP